MSQRVNPSPSPADAASALAATKALHPELANRKDIPLTAFDFLDGAYGATKRARAVGTGLLAVSLVLLGWTVVSGLLASRDVAAMRGEVAAVESARSRLVTDFVGGASVEGIPTESLLAREQALSAGFAGVTDRQGDFLGLLADLRSLGVPGAQVTGLSYGLAASADAAAPAASADDSEEEVTVETVAVRIVVVGESLASTVALADRIKQTPGLVEVQVDLGGTGAVVSAKVTLNKPPDRMLVRLSGLGVRADAAPSSGETSPSPATPTTVVGEGS